MRKLSAQQLAELGAPVEGGAQQIEEWLRTLLRGGTVRLPQGLVELRGGDPVVTTLGDLKRACGVAVETVKQGLRSLELEHWVWLVDGAHTRLLGPPRFRVSISKENLWGSVGRAMELAVAESLNPLESIDYDQLRQRGNILERKRPLRLARVALNWSARIRLANGRQSSPRPGDPFTLAAGSTVRDEEGRASVLPEDLAVRYLGGRDARGSRSRLQLERASIIRLPGGPTGLLEISSQALLPDREVIDWGDDGPWLGRFRPGTPLVLLRRAIYAGLKNVVNEACAGVGGPGAQEWKVVLGVHDCLLDGSIPHRAGRCAPGQSPAVLMKFLGGLGETDSLRRRLAEEYGCTAGAADVRISPAMFAPAYDKKLLRQVGSDPALNSELLCLANKVSCWTQVGAYFRKGEPWPWEVTREIYFTYVDVHYRQNMAGR